MTFSDARQILIDPREAKLAENEALLAKGFRPMHYDIPPRAFYTSADPKYWDERDEVDSEKEGPLACDDGEGE